MANLSLIYEGLISQIQAELTTYTRLADAYDMENNSLLNLVKGYSVSFGSGTNTERQIGCSVMSTARNFIVRLSNLVNANDEDAAGRGNAEKAILEDAYKIWKRLHPLTHLGTVQVTGAKYSEDEGIEYIFEGTNKVVTIAFIVEVEFFE